MAPTKVLVLFSVVLFLQAVITSCALNSFTSPFSSFAQMPGKIVEQSDAMVTKAMETSKSGIESGIGMLKQPLASANLGFIPNSASTLNTMGFDQGTKMKDMGFGFAKTMTGTATDALKSASSGDVGAIAKNAQDKVSSTASDVAGNIKSTAEGATKSVTEAAGNAVPKTSS